MKPKSTTEDRNLEPDSEQQPDDRHPLAHGTSDDIETENGFLATIPKHTVGAALRPDVCEETTHSSHRR